MQINSIFTILLSIIVHYVLAKRYTTEMKFSNFRRENFKFLTKFSFRVNNEGLARFRFKLLNAR